jgi:hypothetical protein
MASIDRGYMAVSELVTGLLASGVNLEKVAGYAAVGFVPVACKLLDVIKLIFFGREDGLLRSSCLWQPLPRARFWMSKPSSSPV